MMFSYSFKYMSKKVIMMYPICVVAPPGMFRSDRRRDQTDTRIAPVGMDAGYEEVRFMMRIATFKHTHIKLR